jgi:hypothetical protein
LRFNFLTNSTWVLHIQFGASIHASRHTHLVLVLATHHAVGTALHTVAVIRHDHQAAITVAVAVAMVDMVVAADTAVAEAVVVEVVVGQRHLTCITASL